MGESLKYSEYRKIIREETKKILDNSLNEEEVVDVLNANLGDDVIAINNAKQGKPVKVMIVKAMDNINKPPIMTAPDGKRKLNSGWTKVKGGLTVTSKNDTEKYQKEAQELQTKANEGKGENDSKFKFIVTADPDAK